MNALRNNITQSEHHQRFSNSGHYPSWPLFEHDSSVQQKRNQIKIRWQQNSKPANATDTVLGQGHSAHCIATGYKWAPVSPAALDRTTLVMFSSNSVE
mmetsp:Transcript_29696/g.81608  ORF Transcript_29696/g.81608 Transcript_29696/m.81608 type:complete len:98 (+) Transcript_29696:1196-1489(+)